MSHPSKQPAVVGPKAIFVTWTEEQIGRWRETNGKRGIAPDNVHVYESIWSLWVRWLDGLPELLFAGEIHRWAVANTEQVQAFLAAPHGADYQRRRAPKKADALANFTGQRYWRVLRDVYACAMALGVRQDNPALGLDRTPRIERRSREPQKLPAGVLRRLQSPTDLERWLPLKGKELVLRDRAALALLAHCGLTVQELTNLRGCDLRIGARTLVPGAQLKLVEESTTSMVKVDVDGRELDLPAVPLAAVLEWLPLRKQMLGEQRARLGAAAAAGADVPKSALLDDPMQPVLLSREAPSGFHTALNPSSLYVIVQRCLRAAYAEMGVATGKAGTYVAAGPTAIRNSLIAQWVTDHGPGEAARRAGLQLLRERAPDEVTGRVQLR